MNATLQLILTIALVIDSVIVIVSILFQSSKSQGLSSALAGSAETFFGKDRARSLDAKLSKVTGVCAALFVVLCFVLNIFN